MHTVRAAFQKLHNRYSYQVQFVEAASDPGYRPTRDTICVFRNYNDAYKLCSFLNGGSLLAMTADGQRDMEAWHTPAMEEE